MTLGLIAYWLLPLIPALIALYFLKLRRQERVVSSTFLWTRSLEDLHVNAPFQRLRRSLLLLLQLLVLAVIILAASKPMLTGTATTGVTRIILLDRSASMNVEEAGGTRFELARRQALEIIDGKADSDLVAIIAFADRPVLAQALTTDAARLRSVVNSLEPSAATTDLLSALQTAASITEAVSTSRVYVISDGASHGLASVPPELERLNLRLVPVGKRGDNTGIVELDVRREFGASQAVQLFLSVLNAGATEQVVTLGLYQGAVLKDATALTIPPAKTASHVFDASEYAGNVLRAEIDSGGALEDDDRAWVRIDPPRTVDVLLVGEGNFYLENVLRVNPLVRARRINLPTFRAWLGDGRLESDAADVVIFDRNCPQAPVERAAIYIGCLPAYRGDGEASGEPGGGEGVGGPARGQREVETPVIIDWDRSHPVNRFLSYAELLVGESRILPAGSRFHSILDSAGGSIIGTVTLTPPGKPAVSHLVIGFDLNRSNWPLLVHSFPIFFSNALAWLGAGSGSVSRPVYRTGEALVYHAAEDLREDLVFESASGASYPAVADASGEVLHADTDRVGVVTLRTGGGQILERFPVSLLDRAESRIEPGRELRIGADRVARPEEVSENRDLWKWFVLAALALALIEWWIYNRRMTV